MLFSFAFGFPLILLCWVWLLQWQHSPHWLNPPLSTQQSLSITYTQTRLLGSKSRRKSQRQTRGILNEKLDHIYFCTYRLQQPFQFSSQAECPGKPVIQRWPRDTGSFKGSVQEGWGNAKGPTQCFAALKSQQFLPAAAGLGCVGAKPRGHTQPPWLSTHTASAVLKTGHKKSQVLNQIPRA